MEELRHQLPDRIRATAKSLGFVLTGIAPAVTPTGFHRLLTWLQSGYAGEMNWVARRQEAYRHPDGVMPGTRSVIMLAMNYHDGTVPPEGARVARYAAGMQDYHDVMKPSLQKLAALIREAEPAAKTRIVIDTAPLLERDFGRLAGIGWFGKNTMLISRTCGSWFFLGAILTDVELPYDDPEDKSYCGTCTRCLDACPTQAFPEPGVLDSRRCISYLTIELRNRPIPVDLREPIGHWLFGCDVCQEVCPWNRFAPTTVPTEFRQEQMLYDCRELLSVTDEDFGIRFRGTPFARTGRSALLRNAAIVLSNLRHPSAIPSLRQACDDPDPLVAEAAAWAFERCSRTSPDQQSAEHRTPD